MTKDPRIDVIHVFKNKTCSVFDKDGYSLSEYQGRWKEKEAEIKQRSPSNAEIKYEVDL